MIVNIVINLMEKKRNLLKKPGKYCCIISEREGGGEVNKAQGNSKYSMHLTYLSEVEALACVTEQFCSDSVNVNQSTSQ